MAINENLSASASCESTPNYEVGFTLTYANKSYDKEKTTVTIKPCLRNIKGVKRFRHYWNVQFALDGIPIKVYQDRVLPINNVGSNVVGAGNFYMNEDEWYYWGDSYTFEIPNDGAIHNIGLWMECLGTVPRYCPKRAEHLWCSVQLPKYTPDTQAPEPKGLYALFDKDTRVIDYRWDTSAEGLDATKYTWDYLTITRTMYKADDTVYGEENQSVSRDSRIKLKNVDIGSVVEIVPAEVVRIKWKVTNYSLSGSSAESDLQEITLDIDSKVWVKVNGEWKKAIPWVKVDGVWKKAIPWIKINGAWKRTIT
jgi:hypothetical protein